MLPCCYGTRRVLLDLTELSRCVCVCCKIYRLRILCIMWDILHHVLHALWNAHASWFYVIFSRASVEFSMHTRAHRFLYAKIITHAKREALKYAHPAFVAVGFWVVMPLSLVESANLFPYMPLMAWYLYSMYLCIYANHRKNILGEGEGTRCEAFLYGILWHDKHTKRQTAQ